MCVCVCVCVCVFVCCRDFSLKRGDIIPCTNNINTVAVSVFRLKGLVDGVFMTKSAVHSALLVETRQTGTM